jgi:hypothetical protein
MSINEVSPIYCCGALDYQIESKLCPVKYNEKWREYSIRDFKSTSLSLMMFCPNCGTRLPSSLRDEWFDILEQDYGLEDPEDDDKKSVPKEFLSDEWWKKRGLMNNKDENIDRNFKPNRPVRCLF